MFQKDQKRKEKARAAGDSDNRRTERTPLEMLQLGDIQIHI